jgi:hypothetical protein
LSFVHSTVEFKCFAAPSAAISDLVLQEIEFTNNKTRIMKTWKG